MSERETSTLFDENEPPTQLLKEAVGIDDLKGGTVFEVDEGKLIKEEDAERTNERYFQSKELLESLRLNYLDNSSDEDDADGDLLPFEKLAKKMERITPDGGVLKRVTRPGAGPVVSEECFVTFHYHAYLEMADEPFDSTRLRNKPQRTLLENVSVVGLALALKTMRKGEHAQVMVSPQYAFGAMGCPPRIPQDATILYEVELVHFIDAKEALDLESQGHDGQKKLPFEKAFQICETKRRTGNEFFNANEVLRALKCYTSAITTLEKMSTANREQEQKQQALLLKLYNNAALCCRKTGRVNMIIAYAKQALQIDKNNAKALYYCGVGSGMLGCYDDAKRYLIRANRIEPNSKSIVSELERLDERLTRERHAEEVMCRRMFGSLDGAKKSQGHSAMNGISDGLKALIRKQLLEFRNELGEDNSVRALPFTLGFTEPHLNYIRLVCAELGLGCEDIPGGGVRVMAPTV